MFIEPVTTTVLSHFLIEILAIFGRKRAPMNEKQGF